MKLWSLLLSLLLVAPILSDDHQQPYHPLHYSYGETTDGPLWGA